MSKLTALMKNRQMCIFKFVQICNKKENVHKYGARVEFYTNMQPKWKFAKICSQNGSLHNNVAGKKM